MEEEQNSPRNLPEITRGEEDNSEVEFIIRLYRNNDFHHQATKFLPKDEIRLDVLGTGISRATIVVMKDIHGQVRFRGRSGGMDHVFKTRIQYTKSYGTWYFEIKYPDNNEKICTKTVQFEVCESIEEKTAEPTLIEEDSDLSRDKTSKKLERVDVLEYSIPISELIIASTPQITKLLHSGISTFQQFYSMDIEKIQEETKLNIEDIDEWKRYVRDVLTDEENPVYRIYWKFGKIKEKHQEELKKQIDGKLADEPVIKIKFVGKKSEEKLNSVGIRTVRDLILADERRLRSTGLPQSLIKRWIEQAYIFLGIEKFDEMKRLEEIKNEFG